MMKACLKRYNSTGAGRSHHKRVLQGPCPQDSMARQKRREIINSATPKEGLKVSAVSRLHSAALALREMDIEVVLTCLNKVNDLTALLQFSESDIRKTLAWAKAAPTQSPADSHAGLDLHDLRVEYGVEQTSYSVDSTSSSQQANLDHSHNPELPPYTQPKPEGTFLASTAAHSQDVLSWPYPPNFPPNFLQIPTYLAQSSPDIELDVPFERSGLEEPSRLPPRHELEYAGSTTQGHLTQVELGTPPYESSDSHSMLSNHSTKRFGIAVDRTQHDLEPVGRKPPMFDCPACTKSFAREFDHRSHYKEIHDKPIKLSCNHCRNDFYVEKRITAHHKRCHRDCPTTLDGDWKDRCVSRTENSKRIAYGCGLCAAPFADVEDYLKHMEQDHPRWRCDGLYMSDDKVINGLLRQPLLAEAWEAIRGPALIYTWRPNDAERLKDCLEYGRIESGAIQDDPETLARALARLALDCAVTKPVENAVQDDLTNPDPHLTTCSQEVSSVDTHAGNMQANSILSRYSGHDLASEGLFWVRESEQSRNAWFERPLTMSS